jgi:hypothetical protein
MKTFSKNLRTKSGDIKKNYLSAWKSSITTENKIYPKHYRGSGRHITLADYSSYIISMLKDLGYKFTEGNDAPRGGAQGYYIKVSSRAMGTIFANVYHQ